MLLYRIIQALAYRAMVDPAFYESMVAMGIDHRDWPDGLPQRVMTDYVRDRESNNHDYAFWNVTQHLSCDDLQRLEYTLPDSEEGIRAAYVTALGAYRGFKLGQALIGSPEQADELVAGFLGVSGAVSRVIDMAEGEREQHDRYVESVMSGESVVTIPTWPRLSDAIGGFNPSRIAICKAASGFGKSLLAQNLALSASKKFPVLYVNMEMSLRDVYERHWAMTSGVSFSSMRQQGPPPLGKTGMIDPGRFFMTDGRHMSFNEIRAIARRIRTRHGLGAFFIDYDQKLVLDVPHGSSEWRESQRAMERFEEMAKELQCFGLVLAQTNREGQISSGHRMRFSASTIWHFRQDEIYGPVIAFEKNRFCQLGTAVSVCFEGKCGSVTEGECVTILPSETRTRI